jgi:hypothetical protein
VNPAFSLRAAALAALGLVVVPTSFVACSSDAPAVSSGEPAASEDEARDSGSATTSDAAPAADDAQDAAAPMPEGLPFSFVRPAAGAPVPASELAAITDKYIALLTQTRHFDVLDERVLGWPESDPQKRYWYGTWWTGAGFEKTAGQVHLVHLENGADNIGIPTSFALESVCLAHKMWPSPKLEHLTRRLIRGFNSWILAMQRMPADPAGVLLARVGYPMSIASNDRGQSVLINYDADRPGIDSYTDYVHIAQNPSWGDVWIKNKRSKDDVGHMLRAIATLEDCAGALSPATRADLAEMRAGYVAWATRVEADGWAIATLDKSGNVSMPGASSTMSRYQTAGNAECNAVVALRLFSQKNPGAFNCGNGIHPLEALAMNNPSNGEIVRSYHEAAVRHALAAKQNTVAQSMMGGLAKRMDDGMGFADKNAWPVHMQPEQLVKLLVHAANTGVPLTWREVRWLHQQIDKAFTSYTTTVAPAVYRIFDPATPDGSYPFTPDAEGIDFRFFASLAGTCVASYRNPTSAPLFDCARLKAWTP